MRVNAENGDILRFDNMGDRPIRATTDWSKYEIVTDVPETSAHISFDVLLTGGGRIWFDTMQFEIVGVEIPTTTKILPYKNIVYPKRPLNLSFEE